MKCMLPEFHESCGWSEQHHAYLPALTKTRLKTHEMHAAWNLWAAWYCVCSDQQTMHTGLCSFTCQRCMLGRLIETKPKQNALSKHWLKDCGSTTRELSCVTVIRCMQLDTWLLCQICLKAFCWDQLNSAMSKADACLATQICLQQKKEQIQLCNAFCLVTFKKIWQLRTWGADIAHI